MEDNANYTYTYSREKKKQAQQRALIIVLSVFGLILVAVILIGILSGRNSAIKKYEKELSKLKAEQSTSTAEVATEPLSPYKEGEYVVTTGGYALKFRKDHAMNADTFLEIQENTKLTVTEIYHDAAAATSGADIEYWGKTTYKGYTGWVAMNYLKKAYSNSIVTPEELLSQTQESTTAPTTQATTEATTEETTALTTQATTAESTTQAPETTTGAAAYTAGNYTVNTPGTTLNFRSESSTASEVLNSIPDGTAVVVKEVVQADGMYWGKIEYDGDTGWVSMEYLK